MLELPKKSSHHTLMPDLTALIDVLFILLVFLLLTAAVKLDMMDVNLPDAGKNTHAPIEQPDALVLSVRFSEQKITYGLAKEPYSSLNTVMQALRLQTKKRPLYLAIDQHVPSGELVKLLAALSSEDRNVANILIKNE
ncbi:biopolymer transporter [Pseudoalteromonas porphyrae]|uniref:Biopolymer transporter n=2 Tax=Pseudoalteromonas TaxID=53246 RepID=A0A0N1EXU1_9GAMM|nr:MULTISPECIES: biopolymer transporter ExbD [Pseudoalteromonas]KPH65576.1 biopolymer transporter [Pseudoalteromonas porphyrae]KPH95608.1 biopolymer transporter [Pseudoalteromonas porphyrae]NNG41676.1 biopolymer transporter [Pseudoalteromonas sp. NEC-BIFX-2020_002]